MNKNEAFSLVNSPNVSRETLDKLWRFCELVLEWNCRFNLVSRQVNTVQLWREHLLDSLQLGSYLPASGVQSANSAMLTHQKKVLDIGSGAGFPGMVLAILGFECILVERVLKKVVFLREAARILNVNCCILNDDVRNLPAEKYANEVGFIVSRAVTSVENILDLSAHLIDRNTKVLLLKSKEQSEELAQLKCSWRFKLQEYSNEYKSEGVVVVISEIARSNGGK